MGDAAVNAARDYLKRLMDQARAVLSGLREMQGDRSPLVVGYDTLVDVLSKYYAHAVDIYGYDTFTELPEDKRNVVLPEGTVLAYVLTLGKDGRMQWFRTRGVSPGSKVSGMYSKITEAMLLGNAAMDAVLSDYVHKEKCVSCSVRDDCRTMALMEFARGLVGAMFANGYAPMDFISLFFAAVALKHIEQGAGRGD